MERKGLAVTLHFRQAPELAGWTANFAAEHEAASGLVAHPGKQSWELRPPGPTDKGTVVDELAVGLQAVCFVGDDIGDLPAFAALTRLGVAGVDTLAVAVGGRGDARRKCWPLLMWWSTGRRGCWVCWRRWLISPARRVLTLWRAGAQIADPRSAGRRDGRHARL